MSVFMGEISHKPSSDHMAGRTRHIDGATDNQLLAQTFGVSGNAGSIASNGKISLIDLFPQNANGTIYADPGELTRMDDLTFINQHLSMVTDYNALTRFMRENYLSELQMKLREVSNFSDFNNLTNEAQKAIVMFYFGQISLQEARQVIGDQTSDDQFKDAVGRTVLGKESTLNFQIHGLEIHATIRTTHFEINQEQHLIAVDFKVTDSDINGSARQIKGSGMQKAKLQFKYFANKARKLSQEIASGNANVKLQYRHAYQDSMFASQITNDLVDKIAKDFDTIKRNIKTVFEQITPEDVGVDEFDDYNPATAINRLWNELGLTTNEITASGIDADSIKNWYQQQISTEEFLAINQAVLVKKLQSALQKRYASDHIDYDAYINRAVEYAKEDLRSADTTKIVDVARPIAHQVIGLYIDSMVNISDIHQLLDVYHMPTHTHDVQIIEQLSSALIERVGQMQADNNPDLKEKIDALVSTKLPKLAIERWEIFLQHQNIVLGSYLDQNLAQKYLSEKIDEHITKILAKARQLNVQNAEDYVQQYLNHVTVDIDNYYQKNFDREKVLLAVKQRILNNLTSIVPYSKMEQGYWFDILNKINDYDLIKQYQHADNLPEFVSRFAPEFENDVQEQVTLKPETVYSKFIENIGAIKQQYVIAPINQLLISKDAPVYDDLPNKAKSEVSAVVESAVDALKNDFNVHVFTMTIYPKDTVKSIIENYLADSSELIAEQLSTINWNELISSISQYEDNLKQSKQILLGMTESFFTNGKVGFDFVVNVIHEKMAEHMFSDKVISLDQTQQIQKDTDKVIDDIKNQFNVSVCQEEDKSLLDKLTDGGTNYNSFILEWLNENKAEIESIIDKDFDWNQLVQLAFEEYAQRLQDETNANITQIHQVLNENVPGEEINSMTDNLFNELVDELNDTSYENNFDEIDRRFESKSNVLIAFTAWYSDNYFTNYLNPNSIFNQCSVQSIFDDLVEYLQENPEDMEIEFEKTFKDKFDDFAINETDILMQDNVMDRYAEIASSGKIQANLIDDIKLVQGLMSIDEYLAKVFPEIGDDY